MRELRGDRAVGIVLAAEQFPLPQRVVRVLDGQRCPVRRGTLGPCGVRRREVAGQHRHGPAVTRDVVHDEQQHPLVLAGREQRRPQRPVDGQVERGLGRRPQEVVHPLAAGVDGREVRGGVEDDLVGPVGVVGEDRAQRLVAGDDVGERGTQRVRPEVAGELQRDRDVVGRVRSLQAVEEPQPLLCEGKRDPGGPRPRGQPGPAGVLGDQARGDAGDGRRLEHRPHRELGAERIADPARQPGGEQRVPAQVEEAVVDPDLGDPEHGGEHLAQRRLRSGAWCAAARRGVLRGGQGGAVELAVHRERQPVQRHERRRHHVLGQQPCRVRPQRAGVQAAHHVRHEPPVARLVRANHHRRRGDLVVPGQRGLDLAWLDPEAADLHLLVGPSQVDEFAVGGPPGQVAGAVHPLSRHAVRVRDEPRRGQPGAVEIPARHTGARDVQLADHARRNRVERVVEQVDPHPVEPGADQAARPGTGGRPVQRAVGDVHGRLGDPVHVHGDRPAGAPPRVPVVHNGQVECLAAEHHPAQGEPGHDRRPGGLGERQLFERRRRLVEHGDALVGEQVEEVVLRTHDFGRHDHDPAAVQQRAPQLPHGEVEGDRVEHRPHVVGVEPEPRPGPVEQVEHVAVRDDNALGPAGRARRVDHVRGVVRVPRTAFGHVEVGRRVRAPAVAVKQIRVDHGRGGGVREHERDPVRRGPRVHGHVRGTRLDHRQQRDHEPRRPGQQHGDT